MPASEHQRTRLPHVTLLLAFGILIGPAGLNLLDPAGASWPAPVSFIALGMLGFLLGEKLSIPALRKHGRLIVAVSFCEALATALLVFLGLIALGVSLPLALLLGGMAAATDPAATRGVIRQSRARGPFTQALLGVAALDGAWSFICFSLMAVAAQQFAGHGGLSAILASGIREIGGGIVLGAFIGLPVASLSGRIRPGEPMQVVAQGAVLLCFGAALWLDVSFLLASVTMGVVVANRARPRTRPLPAIKGVEWPLLILFFVLAGASLKPASLSAAGVIGGGYVILRIGGRFAGAWAGGEVTAARARFRNWMGAALMPQAGVAIGMALVAAQRFPDLADVVLPVVIGATVLFEITGPVLTKVALARMGEISE